MLHCAVCCPRPGRRPRSADREKLPEGWGSLKHPVRGAYGCSAHNDPGSVAILAYAVPGLVLTRQEEWIRAGPVELAAAACVGSVVWWLAVEI